MKIVIRMSNKLLLIFFWLKERKKKKIKLDNKNNGHFRILFYMIYRMDVHKLDNLKKIKTSETHAALPEVQLYRACAIICIIKGSLCNIAFVVVLHTNKKENHILKFLDFFFFSSITKNWPIFSRTIFQRHQLNFWTKIWFLFKAILLTHILSQIHTDIIINIYFILFWVRKTIF